MNQSHAGGLLSTLLRRAALGVALAASAVSALSDQPADPFNRRSFAVGHEAPWHKTPLENCFWQAAVAPDPNLNQYWVDQQAIYPSALFGKLPEGSVLTLTADYPLSRYFSYTSYFPGSNANATGGSQYLADHDIQPDKGSFNPYIEGASRKAGNSYTLRFVQTDPPANPEPNTFYLRNKPFPFGNALVMRIYVPDRATNELGGTKLPKHSLTLADGKTLEGQAACDAIGKFSGRFPFPNPHFKAAEFRQGRDAAGKPFGHPATNPPTLRRLWSITYNMCLSLQGVDGAVNCGANPGSDPNGPGFANPNTAYLEGMIDMRLGEVLVLRAKKPKTVSTYFGNKTFREKGTDMRYYSVCTQESLYSWRIADCVFDEEMPVDKDGYYTVVISRTTFRPTNARYECGHAWVQAPAAGDGFGNIYSGQVYFRHMLPTDSSSPANLKNVLDAGSEAQVLGAYFPKGEYMSKVDFESRYGCKAVR